MPYDPIKELTELVSYMLTDERAQLVIVTGLVGATITAIVGIIFNYMTRQA